MRTIQNNQTELKSYQDDSPLFQLPSIDFRELFSCFLRKIWILGVCALLVLTVTGIYLMRQPKLFEATAVIYVGQEKDRIVQIESITKDDYRDMAELRTVEQSLASSAVMLRVIEANHLRDEPTFARPKKDGGAYTDSELISKLAERVEASLRRGTRLIDLKVFDTDPERAKRLAASFVDEFTGLTYDQRHASTRRAKDSLVEEADRLKAQVEDSERSLQAYRERHPDLPLEEDQNTVVQKLKELNTQLGSVKASRLSLEAEVENLESLDPSDTDAILRIGQVAQLSDVLELTKLINQREAEFAKVQKRYLYKHPTYISTKTELEDLKASLEKTALKVGENIRKRYEAAMETEKKITAEIAMQNDIVLKLEEALIEYNVLKREVDGDRVLYNSVVTRLKETDVTEGIEEGHLRLMVPPMVSEYPVKPHKKLTLAVALALSLGFGAVLILILNWFEGTSMSSAQFEKVLGIPALANIPEGDYEDPDRELVLKTDANSPVAEAFRMLRSSFAFLDNGARIARSVVFTSSAPDEGKSFCAVNYAVALACQGHRTLLIDADLRRPSLGRVFTNHQGLPGLGDYLSGEVEVGRTCYQTEIENLFLMTAGFPKANPSELLGDERMVMLLAEAHKYFDRIIVDTSPLGIVSDSLALTKVVDAACLVVRSGKTPRREALRTARYLQMARAPLAGFVLNRIRREPFANAYYHSGYYGEIPAQQPRPQVLAPAQASARNNGAPAIAAAGR